MRSKQVTGDYPLNPERINNPDLKCVICNDFIPLKAFCYELTKEANIAHVCSDKCLKKAFKRDEKGELYK